jgi:tetratricopeptide (TPR) repeat protein
MLTLAVILLLSPPLPVPGGPEGALDVFLQQAAAGDGKIREESLQRTLSDEEVVCLDGGSRSCAVRLAAALLDPRARPLSRDLLLDNMRFLLAGALADEGALGRAREILVELWEREPASAFRAPALRKLVDLTTRSGQFEQTLSQIMRLGRGLASDERDEVAYLKGRALMRMGHPAEAESALASVSRTSRHGAAALYLRAILALESGKDDQGEDRLCELVRRPRRPGKTVFFLSAGALQVIEHAWLALGSIYHDRGEHQRAVDAFRVIDPESRNSPEALYRMAWSLFRMSRHRQARLALLELFEKTSRFPHFALARILLGYTLLSDCRIDEAEPIFDEVLRQAQELAALGATGLARPDDRLLAQVPAEADVALAFALPDQFRNSLGRLRWAALELERLSSLLPSRAPEHPAERLWTQMSDEASRARHLRRRLAAARAALAARAEDPAMQKALSEFEAVLNEADSRLLGAQQRLQQAVFSDSLDLSQSSRPELRRYLEAEDAFLRAAGQRCLELWQRAEAMAQKARGEYARAVREATDAWIRQASIGRIDSVIGRKQALEVEIQNLAVGRYPLSLLRELAEAGLIDETQEYWPYDGEDWPDEIH